MRVIGYTGSVTSDDVVKHQEDVTVTKSTGNELSTVPEGGQTKGFNGDGHVVWEVDATGKISVFGSTFKLNFERTEKGYKVIYTKIMPQTKKN